MSWNPWSGGSKGSEEPEVPEAEDTLGDEFDINELLIDQPNQKSLTEGLYAEPEGPDPADLVGMKREEYIRVDTSKLRKKRVEKEAGERFLARLIRGDLRASDIPGQGLVSNTLMGIGRAFVAPIFAIFENVGVLLTGAIVMGAFMTVAWMLTKMLMGGF